MKTKYLFLLLALFSIFSHTYAFAQEDETFFPDTQSESIIPPSSSSTPPVMIDDSDSGDVSDVEEYDG